MFFENFQNNFPLKKVLITILVLIFVILPYLLLFGIVPSITNPCDYKNPGDPCYVDKKTCDCKCFDAISKGRFGRFLI
jgi:hypothetical protein